MADELIKVAEDSTRGGFFLVLGTALATVILAIASILIARLLGPQLYGQYALALVVPQLLFLFTDLGINQGIIKFTATLKSKGETSRITEIIKHGLLLRMSTGIAIFVINYAFADQFASFLLQRPDLAYYIRIASIAVLFQVIFTTATSAFVGLDKAEYNALATNVQAIIKTIVSIALVLFGLGVAGATIGYVAGCIAAAVVGFSILLFVLRERDYVKSSCNLSENIKTLLYYGMPLYVSLLLIGFIPLYESVILAVFTADAEIGNYKAATNFGALMTIISIPITTALLPAFSKLNSETNREMKAFFKFANKYTTMIVLPIAILIMIFSNEIVQMIYGTTYQSAPLFLATYCLLYFLVGIGHLTLTSLYNGLGETKITLRISTVTVLTLIILSPFLTKAYGVQGSITAFLLASTISVIYSAHIARKKFRIEFDTPVLFKIYLVATISTTMPLLMINFVQMPKLLSVAIGGLLYLFTYATLVPITEIVTTSELRKATRITQKVRLLALVAEPVLKYQLRILHMTTRSRTYGKTGKIFYR